MPPRQNQPKWHSRHRRAYFALAFVPPLTVHDVARFAPRSPQALAGAPHIRRPRDWLHHKRFRCHSALSPPQPARQRLRPQRLVHHLKLMPEFPLLPQPDGLAAPQHQPMIGFRAPHLAARCRFAIAGAQSFPRRVGLRHRDYLAQASNDANPQRRQFRHRAIRAGWPAPQIAPCWLAPMQHRLPIRLCAHQPIRCRMPRPRQLLVANANEVTAPRLREFDRRYFYSGWLGALGVSTGATGFPNS